MSEFKQGAVAGPATTGPVEGSAPPPEAMLMQFLMGRLTTFALSAVARLGVADHMSTELEDAGEIARRAQVHPGALYRVLRMLASLGVFTQDGHRFGLAPAGEMLRSDSPRSMRHMAIMMGDEWCVRGSQAMDRTIRSGRDGVTEVYGKHVFDLFRDLPDQANHFHRAMTDFTSQAVDELLAHYDFRGIRRLADIGGGHGVLLVRVLRHYPELSGVLFDLPEVVAGAGEMAHFAGLGGRLQLAEGSFFEEAPPDCDAYILKHIIHDWDNEAAARILRHIRSRLGPDGRVLLYEMVVSEDGAPSPAKFLDIEMLANTAGGRERTASEFADLFRSAGLRLNRIVPTRGPMSVLEALPA